MENETQQQQSEESEELKEFEEIMFVLEEVANNQHDGNLPPPIGICRTSMHTI